jgi:replicative superfamily II helicase
LYAYTIELLKEVNSLLAGRPQFDTSAVAVIMTQSQYVTRYTDLAVGHQAVESKLHATLPEFVNAEVAMRVITNLDQARLWLQNTFLWIRMLKSPSYYGLPQLTGPTSRQQLAEVATQEYLIATLQKLEAHGMLQLDKNTGDIMPLDPGMCVPNHSQCISDAFLLSHFQKTLVSFALVLFKP